jgi:hypothetical protein
MDSTTDNIDHLHDMRDEVCGVEARKFVRVSYQNHTGSSLSKIMQVFSPAPERRI